MVSRPLKKRTGSNVGSDERARKDPSIGRRGFITLGVAEAGNAGSELIAGLWTPSRLHKYQYVMSNDLR